jgi:hypothetical protein
VCHRGGKKNDEKIFKKATVTRCWVSVFNQKERSKLQPATRALELGGECGFYFFFSIKRQNRSCCLALLKRLCCTINQSINRFDATL